MTFTYRQVKEIIAASMEAFLETGNYALSYRQACKQFGKVQIDFFIKNHFLKDTSELAGYKRYLLSDIIAAQRAVKEIDQVVINR